jgi:hypothetical protein
MKRPTSNAFVVLAVIVVAIAVVAFNGRDLHDHRKRVGAEHVCGYREELGMRLDNENTPRDLNVPYEQWREAQLDRFERAYVACAEARSHRPSILQEK